MPKCLEFRMDLAASGRGLCDIDRVLFKVTKSPAEKLGFRFAYNRYIFVVQGLPNFLTRELVALNNTLSISQRPRPLAAELIRNAEIIESLLHMSHMIRLKQFQLYSMRHTFDSRQLIELEVFISMQNPFF